MSDEVIIASTTDSAEEIQAAMDHGITAPNPENVLSVVDDEPGEVAGEKVDVEGEKTPPAGKVEKKEEPVAKVDAKPEDELGDRAKKRINKLVAEREAANRRADEAEARAKTLEEAGKKPAEKTEPVVAATDDQVAGEWVKAHPEPQQENFPDYDSFVKDWTKWEMDRREGIAVRKAEDAGRKAAQKVLDDKAAKDTADREAADRTELFQKFEAGKDEARGRYEDFDTVIEGGKDLALSGPMQFVIMDSAVGHDIAYWLAQPENRDEAEHLASLQGSEAIRELGRLERTIELQVASLDEAEPSKAPVKTAPVKKAVATKATAPITPVGGRGVSTTMDLNDPNMRQEDWKAVRNRQEFERRRRRN